MQKFFLLDKIVEQMVFLQQVLQLLAYLLQLLLLYLLQLLLLYLLLLLLQLLAVLDGSFSCFPTRDVRGPAGTS